MRRWIKLNDTRVNADDAMVDALMNLYDAESAEINREALAEDFPESAWGEPRYTFGW